MSRTGNYENELSKSVEEFEKTCQILEYRMKAASSALSQFNKEYKKLDPSIKRKMKRMSINRYLYGKKEDFKHFIKTKLWKLHQKA